MANSATVRTIVDNSRFVVVELSITADSIGELTGTLVDVSGLNTVPTHLSLWRADVSNGNGFALEIYFDATTDVLAARYGFAGKHDYSKFGGIIDTKATGYTGDILYATVGLTAGEYGTSIFTFRKHF